ncbi:MAG: hypothetical protein HC800_03800 [Phormidesmis sp. RL_2_1]|nr:hypothetical protein [Phormidesmis sp. RL_2_1]
MDGSNFSPSRWDHWLLVGCFLLLGPWSVWLSCQWKRQSRLLLQREKLLRQHWPIQRWPTEHGPTERSMGSQAMARPSMALHQMRADQRRLYGLPIYGYAPAHEEIYEEIYEQAAEAADEAQNTSFAKTPVSLQQFQRSRKKR